MKTLLAVMVAASFTLPSTDAAPQSCSPGDTLTGLGYVRVQACRQSPTWLVKRDSMLAYPASWVRWWPTVVAEASIVTLTRTAVSADSAGRRYQFTPALQWHPAFVRVQTEDLDGNVSCGSDWLWFE